VKKEPRDELSRGFALGYLAERDFRQVDTMVGLECSDSFVQFGKEILNIIAVAAPVGFTHGRKHFQEEHFCILKRCSELEDFLLCIVGRVFRFPDQEYGIFPLQGANGTTHCGSLVRAGVNLLGKDFHRGAFGELNDVVHWSLTSLMVRPSRRNIVTAFRNL